MKRFLNEQILLWKMRSGDVDAFGPVYDFYHEKIYRFVYLKTPTRQDAEDITAETFLKAWQYIQEKKPIHTLQAFLYQIARNLVVDFYRSRAAPLESLDEKEIVVADRTDLTLEEKMALKSDMQEVEAALRQLKDAYREVIVLHFLNELSFKEVARIIDKTPGATRVLLHRGIKAVKEILAEEK